MFLEKFSRYFKRYEIILASRKKHAATIPLVGPDGAYSVYDAIQQKLKAGRTTIKQSNNDTVELIEAEYRSKDNTLAILFHRASPDAADPAYRKKKAGKLSVRTANKEADEEQSVSAHLLIRATPYKDQCYKATLEEIPGLSMGVVREIIADILNEYEYKFMTPKNKEETTYCTIKAEGIKSETIADALKTGQANFVTFTRRAPADYVDGDGLWEPVSNIMKLRIKGKIETKDWKRKIGGLLDRAHKDGWESFNIEISDGERKKSVSLDREQDAKEIIFVKADRIDMPIELSRCSIDLNESIIRAGLEVLKRIESGQ